MKKWTIAVVAVLLAVRSGAGAEEASSALNLPGLGRHHHPILIHSVQGQRLFDQGLTLVFAFNHDEAIRSFRRAAALDTSAVMPLWGIALALGPNINLDVDPEREKAAVKAVRKAQKLAKGAPEIERAYVEALAKRYSDDPAADLTQLAVDYRNAMGELSRRYPDDLDAAVLYAEAIMNLRPWKLWTPEGQPEEGTEELVAVLESVLARDPEHIGANHYYIHAIEASPHPGRALPSAQRLEKLAPGAGHLVHMPAHVYMRTGDYAAAASANAAAARADEAYFKLAGANGVYPVLYYGHNLHFLAAAAGMAGRHADAKDAAERAAAHAVPLVAEMPMAEVLLPSPALVALRFQRYADVLKLPEPPDKTPPAARAIWRYARGVALAATGDVAHAEEERRSFGEISRDVGADEMWGINRAGAVVVVAEAVLAARLAAAKGDREGAIALWQKAVEAEDRLAYDQPPGWYYPVRESLGAALFVAGQKEEAEKVFRDDLARNPRNPRSLLGLWESLKAQKKVTDAQWVRRAFQAASKDADSNLRMEDF